MDKYYDWIDKYTKELENIAVNYTFKTQERQRMLLGENDLKLAQPNFEKELTKLDTMIKDLLNSVDQLRIIYDEKAIVGFRDILAEERKQSLL